MKKKRGPVASRTAKRTFHHLPFWTTIVLLLVLASITIVTRTSDVLTTGAVVQTISYMQAGKELYFEVKQYGVKDATVFFSSDIKGGKILFEEDNSIYFEGKTFSKFRVETENIKFRCLDLTLKLGETELNQKGINREEVALYVNGKEQSTVLTKIKDDYNYYNVKCVPEAGAFVIGKAIPKQKVTTGKAVEQPPMPAPPELQPGEEPTAPVVQEPALTTKTFWQKVRAFFGW